LREEEILAHILTRIKRVIIARRINFDKEREQQIFRETQKTQYARFFFFNLM